MTSPAIYSVYAYTIPAGASETISVTGRFVTVLSANRAFKVGFDNGALQHIEAGLTAIAQAGDTFQSVRLDNKAGASDLTVQVGIGMGELRDSRLVVSAPIKIEKAATLTTTADVSCTDAAVTQILAANSVRRRATVLNLDSARSIRIGDGSVTATRGLRLGPGESITIEATASIHARNDSGAAVSVAVLEEVD